MIARVVRNSKSRTKPVYALVSCLDSMFLLRRSLSALLTSDAGKQKIYADKGARELGSLSDLPSNAILDRGAIIGLWEYDPESSAIVWSHLARRTKRFAKWYDRTETFIRDQLGDARSFSLDSPKSGAPRIAAIRKARSARNCSGLRFARMQVTIIPAVRQFVISCPK